MQIQPLYAGGSQCAKLRLLRCKAICFPSSVFRPKLGDVYREVVATSNAWHNISVACLIATVEQTKHASFRKPARPTVWGRAYPRGWVDSVRVRNCITLCACHAACVDGNWILAILLVCACVFVFVCVLVRGVRRYSWLKL